MGQVVTLPKHSGRLQHNDYRIEDTHVQDEFNFEYWRDLHKFSPEEFEKQRRLALQTLINSKSSKHQIALNLIQDSIEEERLNFTAPMGSCLKIYSMMMDYFLDDFTYSVNTFEIKQHIDTGKLTNNNQQEAAGNLQQKDINSTVPKLSLISHPKENEDD